MTFMLREGKIVKLFLLMSFTPIFRLIYERGFEIKKKVDEACRTLDAQLSSSTESSLPSSFIASDFIFQVHHLGQMTESLGRGDPLGSELTGDSTADSQVFDSLRDWNNSSPNSRNLLELQSSVWTSSHLSWLLQCQWTAARRCLRI